MVKKHEIIKYLSKFCVIEEIRVDIDAEPFEYSPINHYIELLKNRVKPETAASDFIRELLSSIYEGSVSPEVNIESGFIDFILKDKGIGNPIFIELKPLFKLDKTKNMLIQNDLNYNYYLQQIQKYLKKKDVEYVILTNINKSFIFNRTALVDGKPFIETTLSKIFEDYLDNDSLWDNIRRYEDNLIPAALDTEFFNDLKKWFDEFKPIKLINGDKFNKEELIVLFLNKFIFIKTLEDYGLIPYRFIQGQFEDYAKRWVAKGNLQIFNHFFHEIEDFFEIHYDTELFSSNFWDFIDKNENNLRHFRSVFELILGLDKWSLSFGKGIVHYNYRQVNEDIFGKAYETWIAENRKDEGIYYTPATITEYMSEIIVDELLKEPIDLLLSELKNNAIDESKVHSLVNKIQNTRFIDSASGSGSFLIKVLRRIYYYYEKLDDATQWAASVQTDNLFSLPDNVRIVQNFRTQLSLNSGSELVLISQLILNHIFAADKDERALDTAKTNIWKEAIKLNPHIYNYSRLDNEKIHILPNLEMNLIKGDSLTDFDFQEQIDIIYSEFKEEIVKLHEIRNNYLNEVYKPELLTEIKQLKEKIRNRLMEGREFKDSLYFPLEFFFCFFNPNGEPLSSDKWGFDGVISNPPWEAIKPVKKEFSKQGKYEMDVLHFTNWFKEKLEADNQFKEDWNKYVNNYFDYTKYLYEKYSHQSTGDPNFYKFFIERDFQLIRDKGLFCLLVPSGFQTDEGSKGLRILMIIDYHLRELASFENRGYKDEDKKYKTKLFPEVHPQFKFSIVFAKKENLNGAKHQFRAKFYLLDPKELKNGNNIYYDIAKIKAFSPESLSIMEFRNEKDYETCLKIKDEHPYFIETNYRLRREFDMTNDSKLFYNFNDLLKFKGEQFLRLYEGKMIHQFSSSFSQPRYFLKEEESRQQLFRKVLHRIKRDNNLTKEEFEKIKISVNVLLDYQTFRLAYRAIGRSTDERTLISSIVPPKVFIGNSGIHVVNILYYIENETICFKSLNYNNLIYLMSLFNSLTMNYYIRNKISANLNMFYIYELPIAKADEDLKQKIIRLGFSLLYRKSNKADFEDLKNELALQVDEERDLETIRAELEIIIAKKLYKLDYDDWKYICSTFIYGESGTRAELDEIIRISKENWDK